MKFKTAYIYIILGIAVIIFLAITISNTSNNNTKVNSDSAGSINNNQEMPNDEIHKGLNPPTKEKPDKDNVSKSVMHELSALKKAVEKNPEDTVKLRQYANILLSSHKPLEALKYYQKIAKINPRRTDAHFSIAFIYYNQRNFDKAEEETNKILMYDKNNPQALYNLGAISIAKGNREKGKQIWEKIVNNHPGTEIADLAKSSLKKLQ